jgi:hypothetical protein
MWGRAAYIHLGYYQGNAVYALPADCLDNIAILKPQHVLIFRRPHVEEEQEEFYGRRQFVFPQILLLT